MNEITNTIWDQGISELERQGLRRDLRAVNSPQGRKIVIDGKEVLNFCSNNYLGLADDVRLQEAALGAMKTQGWGAGASRLVCGNMAAHQRLEETIARFKGAEGCLVFSTGYMVNVGIISSLFDHQDIIFSDRLNHASIIDGILLSQAKFRRYPHNDMKAMEEMLKANTGFKKRGIVTDTVFSMDGDTAPLAEIAALAEQYDCLVMIDEAHALGVMGENGKGLAEHCDVEDKIDVQMGTLSKAAGSFGAYCCGSKALIAFLLNKARSFIYTTAMPPAVAAASQKGIEIIAEEPHLRKRLWENTRYMHQALKQMGFDVMRTQTPIIPILVREPPLAMEFSKRLFEQGIFISAIRPPTVPQHTARLRLTVMATHTREDLDYVLKKLEVIGRDLDII